MAYRLRPQNEIDIEIGEDGYLRITEDHADTQTIEISPLLIDDFIELLTLEVSKNRE